MLAQGNDLRLRDQGGSRGRSRTQDQKTRTVSTCWSNPGGLSPKGYIPVALGRKTLLRCHSRFFSVSCRKNSRRLWRSKRRNSRSIPEGRADFPAAIFLAGKCPNLGRNSISCCRKIGEDFSSSVEISWNFFPARSFRQPQPSRFFSCLGGCGSQGLYNRKAIFMWVAIIEGAFRKPRYHVRFTYLQALLAYVFVSKSKKIVPVHGVLLEGGLKRDFSQVAFSSSLLGILASIAF